MPWCSIGSSGKGGATLLRRNFGEAVESLTGGEYYWMAGNFMKYGASEAILRQQNPGDLPVDSHELIALCRTAADSSSATASRQRATPSGSIIRAAIMAAVAAGPCLQAAGRERIWASPDDYHNADHATRQHRACSDGELAWRQHDGGHTDAPNVKYFIQWADKLIGHSAAATMPQ